MNCLNSVIAITLAIASVAIGAPAPQWDTSRVVNYPQGFWQNGRYFPPGQYYPVEGRPY